MNQNTITLMLTQKELESLIRCVQSEVKSSVSEGLSDQQLYSVNISFTPVVSISPSMKENLMPWRDISSLAPNGPV